MTAGRNADATGAGNATLAPDALEAATRGWVSTTAAGVAAEAADADALT